MGKYCKPMGLYVTYLDCMECEDKECIQSHRNENRMIDREYIKEENKAYDNIIKKGYTPQGADQGFKTVCVMKFEHPEHWQNPVKRGKSEIFHFKNWQEADRELPNRKEKENSMRKWVAFFLLEPEQKVFFVFGDKKYKVVVQGIVKECAMYLGKQARYYICGEKVVNNKHKLTNKEAREIKFHCKNCNIDTGDTNGSWAVFTTKEKCVEWIRN